MRSRKGLLFVISGPSGAGKGTVLKELFKRDKELFYSVSATTRQPRNLEAEGINYYFKSKEQFLEMIENKKLLEYTEFCGNYYGTPADEVNKKLDAGLDVILEIEVDGAKQVKKLREDSILVFIMPPSVDELKNRLIGRNTETDEKISLRLQEAATEMEQVAKYDYIVVNDIVEKAAETLLRIIKAEREKNNK
jgi:guanylate kinase